MTKLLNKKKNKLVFVTKSDKFIRGTKYSIILSPEFYWVKKVKLPVKSISAAKKLAPSLFEGNLPDGNYSYEIRSAGKEFIVIAYDKDDISKKLEKIFPLKSDIKEVYFAQDALNSIDECVSVNDTLALSNFNGIIIQIPRKCTNSNKTLNEFLDKAILGKNRIRLNQSGDMILEKRDIVLISTIFGIISTSLLIEYFSYKRELSSIENKKATIIREYKLPRTMYQLKSIKKSLSKKFKNQKSLREILYIISKITLKDGEYIEMVDLNSKNANISIHLLDAKREDEIKKELAKKLKIVSSSFDNNSLELKVTL